MEGNRTNFLETVKGKPSEFLTGKIMRENDQVYSMLVGNRKFYVKEMIGMWQKENQRKKRESDLQRMSEDRREELN